MHSLNMKDLDNIIADITDEEISMYDSTPIDKKLVDWAKENCKNNYISLKKRTLIGNLINDFDEDEELLDYFSTWDYTTDYLRISLCCLSAARTASIPTNDWSRNSVFVLSNKKLYIINSGQYYDYINTISYDLETPKNLDYINLYKNKNAELLEINSNGSKMIYKTCKNRFSSLIEEIGDNPISSKISLSIKKNPPSPPGKIAIYIYCLCCFVWIIWCFLRD